ncbi:MULTISPECIES: hypothetical protein [Synergistaceae]|uniref:hypothetical protein n=1 Tax=Synergistaceae TaxID=649777 RepID=UPI003AE31A68|nr:hypothetical protein [Synergistaceae bacterium DZ-S4]
MRHTGMTEREPRFSGSATTSRRLCRPFSAMRIATSRGIFMPHFAIVVAFGDDGALRSYNRLTTV